MYSIPSNCGKQSTETPSRVGLILSQINRANAWAETSLHGSVTPASAPIEFTNYEFILTYVVLIDADVVHLGLSTFIPRRAVRSKRSHYQLSLFVRSVPNQSPVTLLDDELLGPQGQPSKGGHTPSATT